MKKLIYSIVTGFVLLSAMSIGGLSFAQEPTYATLLPGKDFNKKIKGLASGSEDINITYVDSKIQYIKEAPLSMATGDKAVVISAYESDLPIHAWFNTGDNTIYYRSEASVIKMNASAESMFRSLAGLKKLDISNFDTSEVSTMQNMFLIDNKPSQLEELDLSSFDTSSVKNMKSMFNGFKSLKKLDLSSWDTSQVTDMSNMFLGCSNLMTIYASDSFSTSKVTSSSQMFNGATNLEGGNGTKVSEMGVYDKKYAKIDRQGQLGYFTEKPVPINESILVPGPEFNEKINKLKLENEGEGSEIKHYGIKAIKRADSHEHNPSEKEVEVSLPGVVEDKKVYIWFEDKGVEEREWTLYYYSDSDVIYTNEDSSYMFSGLSSLIELDLNLFNTSSTTNMEGMFKGVKSLSNLDLSNFNTENVTNMVSMFEGCESLEELDLSSFDTSKVESMEKMFYNCKSLKSLDLSNFNTENVTNMRSMFNSCFALETLNMSNFDTTKVENMQTMFHDLKNIKELDLTSFNTENVTNMDSMFNFSCSNCSELETVYVSDKFSTDGIGDGALMFQYNDKLIGGNGTRFSDINNKSKDYAKIDKPGQSGYFTDATNITVKFIDENGDELYATGVAKGNVAAELTSDEIERETGHSLEYYADEGMTEEFYFDQPITKYTEIYTQWTVKQYHIAFVDRKGEVVSGADYNYGTPKADIVLPDAPEREGYGFSGWAGIPETMPAENVTGTAEYNIKQYTITFVDGSGENAAVVYTGKYNSSVNTDYPTWTKDGYTISWDKPIPANMPLNGDTITASWTVKSKPSGGNSGGYSGGGGHNHNNSGNESAGDEQKENNTQEQETTPTDNQKNESETQGKDNTQNATHEWSYQNGLTKYINASDARLGDSLTRSEMAKLASIFATKVLGETPDESKQSFCSQFADISKLNGEMRDYVIKACELGYMGYQSNGVDELVNFRPYSPVTVAEASVIVSRMMWGNQNASSGKNWYKGHLYAAYNHGLLDDIRNPYRNITRGEAFEMFYRTSQAK